MDLFLVPYSRVLRYRCVKRAQLTAEGYTERRATPMKAGVILRCCMLPHPFSLHITCQKRGRNIISYYSKKKQYITPLLHPLLFLECVTPRSNMITAAHLKYSNCIRYNFFIFSPICMKFSHNILNTYSFILSIIKHKRKIRRFWLVDPLNAFFPILS